MRIKIPSIKQRPYKVTAVESLFKFSPGIVNAKASPVTGSLVLTYDPDVVHPTALIGILKQNYYLQGDASRLVNRAGSRAISTVIGRTVGKAAFSWAVGRALQSNGLGMLSAFI
jgi:hypothetical protein